MTLVFRRSAAQESELQALISAQQSSSFPQYHAWLTPEEFAARFAVADSDLAAVELWLNQQGFTVEGISQQESRDSPEFPRR